MDDMSEVSTVVPHQLGAVQRIVWVDKNHDTHSNRRTTKYIHQLDPEFEKLTTVEKLFKILDKVEENHKFSIILISSGSLIKDDLEKLDGYSCVQILFIYCYRKDAYKNLQSLKLGAVCSEESELVDRIKIFIYQNSDRLDVDVLFDITAETSSKTVDLAIHQKPNLRFIWNYQCYRFMMETSNFRDDRVKQEMIDIYEEKCSRMPDDSLRQKYLDDIEKFTKETIEKNADSAISWYTKNSCFYRFVNEAFRKLDTCEIFRCRYLISIIFKQLTRLSQSQKAEQTERFHCYRGQHLDHLLIKKIKEHIGHFLSFKSFLSTSKNKQKATHFCSRNSNSHLEAALFKITVDPKMAKDAIFADIHALSDFKGEREILFSVGTIFRIDSVTYDESHKRYRIGLSLCNKSELLINKYIERTYPMQEDLGTSAILFGKLYMDMGEIRLALKHFFDCLEYWPSSNEKDRAIYLNNIGICYRRLTLYDDARRCYEEAIRIYKTLANSERGLSFVYHNMGSMLFDSEEFRQAKNYALLALSLRTQRNLERAMTLDLIGQIHLEDDELLEAKEKFDEAFRIRSHLLAEVDRRHPDLASSYRNLGLYHFKNADRATAKELLKTAANIYSQLYLSDHPALIEVNAYLSQLQQR